MWTIPAAVGRSCPRASAGGHRPETSKGRGMTSLGMPIATPPTVLQAVLMVIFFGLFFYQWGATNLEGFLNYPLWRDMGGKMTKDDYVELFAAHRLKLLPLLVIPFALYTVVTVALVVLAPKYLPRQLLFAILGLQAVVFLSSVIVQAPLRVQLDTRGHDPAKSGRLITTDLWLRKIPSAAQAILVTTVLWIVVRR